MDRDLPCTDSLRDEPARRSGTIVLLGNIPFASCCQRPQQISMCLAGSRPIVYVDPNRSFLQLLRTPAAVSASEVPDPSRRLRLFRPNHRLPFGRMVAAIHRRNCRSTVDELKRYLADDPIDCIVATFPDQLPIVRCWPDVPLVYDVMDDPTLFAGRHNRSRIEDDHTPKKLLERADAVIVTSRLLLDRSSSACDKATCISNGVSSQLCMELRKPSATDERLRDLPGPILGYVGTIAHWFDFEAIAALAEANPTASVPIIGPVHVKPPRLPGNVRFLGPVPHRLLATILSGFDLGLIPFRRRREIDAVNPVKFFEYMAAGLPVLSARFTEMERYAEHCSLYDSPASCVELAAKALREPTSPARRARQGIRDRAHVDRKGGRLRRGSRPRHPATPQRRGTVDRQGIVGIECTKTFASEEQR